MKAICNGRIVMPDQVVEGQALLFDRAIIGLTDPENLPADMERFDAKGQYVIPGLVDIHIHGFMGDDASDGDAEGIRRMARAVARHGVTSFLPTTMTVSTADLVNAFRAIADVQGENAKDAAEILGINAEGPFINPTRKGAQAAENILAPDVDFILQYRDLIRLVTLAPEMEGGLDFIRRLTDSSSIRVSLGHTNATFAEAMAAFGAGATLVTHLFNAMSALTHREPGVVGAAFASQAVYAELIADAFHVHPGLFATLYGIKGDHLCLVSDCTRAGGMADGTYDLGGQPIFVQGVECRLADGTIAGSVLKLNKAVKNLMQYGNLPVWQAVAAATLTPANAIGAERKGALLPGRDADIVLCDDDFVPSAVYRAGQRII